MPTFNYRCSSCGDFALKQKMTDDPLEKCPRCDATVTRLISRNVGIQFRGTGFYITETRESGGAGQAADDGS